jgi:secondary thiamine-phosphate synthase enzyme
VTAKTFDIDGILPVQVFVCRPLATHRPNPKEQVCWLPCKEGAADCLRGLILSHSGVYYWRFVGRYINRGDWYQIVSYQHQILITTKGHGDMHDLTGQVAAIVTSAGIRTGTVNIFNVGSTAAVGTIEFEPGLQHDLPAILDKLIPPSRQYGHEQAWHDGNGHSHLQATLLGPSVTVPIAEGKLVLGTWQQIFHLECDIRGRQRTVVVTVVGD